MIADPTIVTSLTTVVISVISFYQAVKLKRLETKTKETEQELKETNAKISALDTIMDFEAFTEIKETVDLIFENTNIDRFLILIAVNGKTDLGTVSVIFEQNASSTSTKFSINAISKYHSFKVDSS